MDFIFYANNMVIYRNGDVYMNIWVGIYVLFSLVCVVWGILLINGKESKSILIQYSKYPSIINNPQNIKIIQRANGIYMILIVALLWILIYVSNMNIDDKFADILRRTYIVVACALHWIVNICIKKLCAK